jgi:hypothetical protein
MPASIVAGERVEDDGDQGLDQGLDVLDIGGLRVEVGDDEGLVCVIGVEEDGVIGETASCCSAVARSHSKASVVAFSYCHMRAATYLH